MKKTVIRVALCFFLGIIASCSGSTDDDLIPGGGEEELTMKTYPAPEVEENPIVDYTKWEIKNGKFYLDGEWVFLKIARPLIDYGWEPTVDALITNLDKLREKYHYNVIEISCYWHFFDTNGDGVIDRGLAPLNKMINAVYDRGMYPTISTEIYSVGGAQIPEGFWATYPDAYAIDDKGNEVNDTEYGFGTKVVSQFHQGFQQTSRTFIKNLFSGIDTDKILYYDTTVEPQYMGSIPLCYSDAAKSAYAQWRIDNNITDQASEMPASFPIPSSFIKNATWNKFRAQHLAEWINGDAAAYREVAGHSAYVATDYLDADESVQYLRCGDPIEFLTHLTATNIIQVNWHWHLGNNAPNNKAYERVWQVKNNTGRDWAIAEHMTLNGSDFNRHTESGIELIFENALAQGTRFGFEFVNVRNNTTDPFTLYHSDWSSKRIMNIADKYWGWWIYRAQQVENEK